MTIQWNHIYRLAGILIIVIGMFMGCASVLEFFENPTPPESLNADEVSLEHALAVYQYGDYKKAMGAFKALSYTGASESHRRTARLGEICCRLMLANTQADYTDAIEKWKKFRKSATSIDAERDVALIDPLILRLSVLGNMRRTDSRQPATRTPIQPKNADGRQHQTELANMKKKAKKADQLQRQLDAVAAENRSLKEKIKALEAIDQNIQKKKTEISAPSE